MELSTTFFKPNPKSTGALIQFRTAFSEKSESYETYFTIVKQVSWDSERKVGSFKSEDKDNSVAIKVNLIELGSFIYSIRNNESYSTVHKSSEGMTSIKFGPFTRGDSSMFGFSISKSKQKYSVSLTMQEAEVFNIFCQNAVALMLRKD